jgi:hypothetical protein
LAPVTTTNFPCFVAAASATLPTTDEIPDCALTATAAIISTKEIITTRVWSLSDKRLQAGEGRTAALSAVQLEMLRSNDQAKAGDGRGLTLGSGSGSSHPFFWASFIQSGDWKSMSGQESKMK